MTAIKEYMVCATMPTPRRHRAAVALTARNQSAITAAGRGRSPLADTSPLIDWNAKPRVVCKMERLHLPRPYYAIRHKIYNHPIFQIKKTLDIANK